MQNRTQSFQQLPSVVFSFRKCWLNGIIFWVTSLLLETFGSYEQEMLGEGCWLYWLPTKQNKGKPKVDMNFGSFLLMKKRLTYISNYHILDFHTLSLSTGCDTNYIRQLCPIKFTFGVSHPVCYDMLGRVICIFQS